ncbi:MAG: hypothetical protein JKX76_14890 [Colwellia sp.]|nr:hypothetical protein [Colwellia sp.]
MAGGGAGVVGLTILGFIFLVLWVLVGSKHRKQKIIIGCVEVLFILSIFSMLYLRIELPGNYYFDTIFTLSMIMIFTPLLFKIYLVVDKTFGKNGD